MRIWSAVSRIRASFRICCITWIATTNSDGDTSTTGRERLESRRRRRGFQTDPDGTNISAWSGLAGDRIFPRWLLMLHHVWRAAAWRIFLIGVSVMQRGHRFQRKLPGYDAERSLIREEHHATGRLLAHVLEFVGAARRAVLTIASIRACSNAPRDRLLASTSRSVVTCGLYRRKPRGRIDDARAVLRPCTRKLSMVLRVVCPIDYGRDGSRIQPPLTARAISAWRPAMTRHRINPIRPRLCAEHFAQALSSSARIACAIASSGPRWTARSADRDHQQQDKGQRPGADQRFAGFEPAAAADQQKNPYQARRGKRDHASARTKKEHFHGKMAGLIFARLSDLKNAVKAA